MRLHATAEMQRIVLANDEAEMRLVSHLTPSTRLHGILNKSVCRLQPQEHLLQLRTQRSAK